jgi:hypothetical protein
MTNFIVGIIGITLGVVCLSGVFMASTHLSNGNCLTGWNGTSCNGYSLTAGEYALWGLLGIAGVAGMVFGVLNVFGLA